ncbi:hypothetical protein GCM10029978_009240 [Actinoallomurus acanthiterrae]
MEGSNRGPGSESEETRQLEPGEVAKALDGVFGIGLDEEDAAGLAML